MHETTRHISPLQYAIIETTSFMGIGIFEFPRVLVMHAGSDVWWGFLADWLAAYVGAWLLLKVAYVNPRETLLGAARDILSSTPYWIFGIADTVVHLILPVLAIAQFSFLVVTFFLPNTPIWLVDIALTAMSVYVTWWDLPALARTTQVIYLPVMAISVVLLTLLVPYMTDSYAAIPSLDLHVLPTLTGAFKSLYIFIGFEVIPIFWPYIRPDEQPRARRYTYLALTAAGVFYSAIIFATLTTENPWYLEHLQWPAVSALRLINVSGLIINKLGLLIVVLWGIVSLFFISIRFWAISHVIMPLIRRRTLTWYRGINVCLAVLVVGVSLRFPNIRAVDTITKKLIPPIIVFVYAYPVVYLIVARLLQHRRHHSSPSPANS